MPEIPRRIVIDPKLWASVRMEALSRNVTAALVVDEALRSHLSKQEPSFDEVFGAAWVPVSEARRAEDVPSKDVVRERVFADADRLDGRPLRAAPKPGHGRG